MDSPTDEESENMKFLRYFKSANLTEEDYLISLLGPKHLSLHVAIPMTILYLAIFFTGILGNIITCMVIIKNSSMQNATNYYLFSLAISDLTLLALGKYSTSLAVLFTH
ncbi:neuropeptides capa receptor-like [Belonocnema kinseyi]|uniref:neuropeptides capa receptor-like n=1 Tax=Belonocnema kinseyi TaxID=2817044 RepID=UPI00143D1F7E|nr:neuropeptides capa receptor-like [Belonocnema kinseyi]